MPWLAKNLTARRRKPTAVVALSSSSSSTLLTVALALVFTEAAHLSGFASEEATYLQLGGADFSLEGLLLAGMVIGALGVLDDVTVSQDSTVLALRAANPGLGFRELFTSGLRVGRDHVSATLVLAYVGASLPVLLIFSATDLGLSDAFNLEIVAKEVVATLVGSIGLIAAVPVTTALVALLSLAEPTERLARAEHAAPALAASGSGRLAAGGGTAQTATVSTARPSLIVGFAARFGWAPGQQGSARWQRLVARGAGVASRRGRWPRRGRRVVHRAVCLRARLVRVAVGVLRLRLPSTGTARRTP